MTNKRKLNSKLLHNKENLLVLGANTKETQAHTGAQLKSTKLSLLIRSRN